MIKKFLTVFFLLITTNLFAKETIIVGTYDSFAAEWGPGPQIEKLFEPFCNKTYFNYSEKWINSRINK